MRLDEAFLSTWQGSLYSHLSGIGSYYGARTYQAGPKLEALVECGYCGNKYSPDARTKFHNCPTCAGSFK